MNDQQNINVWRRVVQKFSLPSVSDLQFEEISAGFSGAKIVRVSAGEEIYALRGWPIPSLPRQRIQELHRFLSFLKGHRLPVAAPYYCSRNLESLIEDESYLWQMEPWLAGSPRDGNSLTAACRQAMMQTLAKVHLASAQFVASNSGQEWFANRQAIVPAVHERFSLINKWNASRIEKCRNELKLAPRNLRNLSVSVLDLYQQNSSSIAEELQQLSSVTSRLFPCWRDLWRDHVLFEGDNVTGLIDASATRLDHVGTDLSRLLGSFFEDDQEQWRLAIGEYSEVRPLTSTDLAMIDVLDRSSVLLSGMTWLDRWRQRSIPESKMTAVVERLIVIQRRMCQL